MSNFQDEWNSFVNSIILKNNDPQRIELLKELLSSSPKSQRELEWTKAFVQFHEEALTLVDIALKQNRHEERALILECLSLINNGLLLLSAKPITSEDFCKTVSFGRPLF